MHPFSMRRGVVALACTATLALFATAARAEVVNGYHILLQINGNPTVNVHGGGPNAAVHDAGTRNEGGVAADFSVDADRFTAARMSLSGSGSATGRVQATSTFGFHLVPPAGANVKGGNIVLHVVLDGSTTGSADLHLATSVRTDVSTGSGSGVINDAGTHRVEFDVPVSIPVFIDDLTKLGARINMNLIAQATLSGGAAASATATPNTRVAGFRVLNSAGVQVPGFTMVTDGGNIPELTAGPPSGGTKVVAVEFYHDAFKHYFVSTDPGEIAKLDNGTFKGWKRTGQSFNVYSAAAPGRAPVCRFFTVAFPPTSSHFYAPRGLGCEGTLTNTNWQYEGDVFFVPLPDGAGNCPAGSIPVYRLYNQGQGGAPNHRFTTSEATRQEMLAKGFLAEGAGIGVGFCSPQ